MVVSRTPTAGKGAPLTRRLELRVFQPQINSPAGVWRLRRDHGLPPWRQSRSAIRPRRAAVRSGGLRLRLRRLPASGLSARRHVGTRKPPSRHTEGTRKEMVDFGRRPQTFQLFTNRSAPATFREAREAGVSVCREAAFSVRRQGDARRAAAEVLRTRRRLVLRSASREGGSLGAMRKTNAADRAAIRLVDGFSGRADRRKPPRRQVLSAGNRGANAAVGMRPRRRRRVGRGRRPSREAAARARTKAFCQPSELYLKTRKALQGLDSVFQRWGYSRALPHLRRFALIWYNNSKVA